MFFKRKKKVERVFAYDPQPDITAWEMARIRRLEQKLGRERCSLEKPQTLEYLQQNPDLKKHIKVMEFIR